MTAPAPAHPSPPITTALQVDDYGMSLMRANDQAHLRQPDHDSRKEIK